MGFTHEQWVKIHDKARELNIASGEEMDDCIDFVCRIILEFPELKEDFDFNFEKTT